jgi:hypothetical protein
MWVLWNHHAVERQKHHSLWLLQHQFREASSIHVLELRKDILREYGHYAGSRTMPGDAIFAASNNRLL